MLLLDFPPELFTRILLFLPLADLAVCRRISCSVNDLIHSSVELQYSIELEAAGAEETSPWHLVLADRLHLLKAREAAWRSLAFSRVTTIPVFHLPSSIYGLTSGVFLLGETSASRGTALLKHTDALQIARLPSFQDSGTSKSPPVWSKIALDASVIDIGLAVQEHDLIAVVTYQCVPSFPNIVLIKSVTCAVSELGGCRKRTSMLLKSICFSCPPEDSIPWRASL